MKKILLYACFLLIAITASAQKQFRVTDKWVVKNVPGEEAPGMVTVMSTGFGKDKAASIADSKTAALYIFLFRGIADSKYPSAMIPNEASVKDNKVLNDLIDNGSGNTFFTQVDEAGSTKMSKKKDGIKGVETRLKIGINVDALRKFLEQNKIIQPFGY